MSILTNFPSGLRLVHRQITGVRSVAIGVLNAVGSANEPTHLNGISHYLEHMFFKGTKKRTAFDISAQIEGLGAQINAFTSKQLTCYYTHSIDEHADICADILSDILFNSLFDEAEMEKEKGVVIEEIRESLDDPGDLCSEALAEAYFGEHPLGRSIIGTEENINKFTRQDLLDYIKTHYKAKTAVISIVGNITKQDAIALVEKYFEGKFGEGEREFKDEFHQTEPKTKTIYDDFELSNIAYAFPSYPINHPNDTALKVLNTCFGGGMSSRLFQSVRETHGLAYSVYSYPSAYSQNGYTTIFSATAPEKVEKMIEVLQNEVKLLIEKGLTEAEFLRAREQLKGAYVLAQESTASLMNLYGRYALMTGKEFDFDEQIAKIQNVTMADVNQAIKDVFDFSKMSTAYVGRKIDGVEF